LSKEEEASARKKERSATAAILLVFRTPKAGLSHVVVVVPLLPGLCPLDLQSTSSSRAAASAINSQRTAIRRAWCREAFPLRALMPKTPFELLFLDGLHSPCDELDLSK
jgi:hypothetical protein